MIVFAMVAGVTGLVSLSRINDNVGDSVDMVTRMSTEFIPANDVWITILSGFLISGKTYYAYAYTAGDREFDEAPAALAGVEEDTAFQTNLLALNAAVEAVRAGEAGKDGQGRFARQHPRVDRRHLWRGHVLRPGMVIPLWTTISRLSGLP